MAKTSPRKAAYNREYRIKNLEKLRAYHKKWESDNPEKCKIYQRRYYESLSLERKKKKWASLTKYVSENPLYPHQWAARNRSKLNFKSQQRRLRILGQIHPEGDIKKIKEIYRNRPEGSEVDHIIPISAGGWHHEMNLQYLPRSINRSKCDNVLYEPQKHKFWMDVPMFLLPEKSFLNDKDNSKN